ncbi:glycosyltransferase [Candidatus Roizmanbacteria bacterium]|nr:glycosyltransferase [Candidatus Roizmanbacteria bacterium]
MKRSDLVIVPTQYTRREVGELFPWLPPARIKQIYYGADHLTKPAATTASPFPEPFFLYVGVLKPIKNIALLFASFATLLASPAYGRFRLVCLGDREKAYFELLKKSPAFGRIKSRVTFIDSVSDAVLSSYYSRARAVLNLSREEGFAFPVVEAAAMGTPVIVSDLPLYHEFRPYFPNLLPVKNTEGVLKAVQRLKDLPRQKPLAAHPFTWKNFMASLVSLTV